MLFELLFATIISALPSPLTSAAATEYGLDPAEYVTMGASVLLHGTTVK